MKSTYTYVPVYNAVDILYHGDILNFLFALNELLDIVGYTYVYIFAQPNDINIACDTQFRTLFLMLDRGVLPERTKRPIVFSRRFKPLDLVTPGAKTTIY